MKRLISFMLLLLPLMVGAQTAVNLLKAGGGTTMTGYGLMVDVNGRLVLDTGTKMATQTFVMKNSGRFLGEYATLSALQSAYPTGRAGDWATIKATGAQVKTYRWDTQYGWVFSDASGSGGNQVAIVNGITYATAYSVFSAKHDPAPDSTVVTAPQRVAGGPAIGGTGALLRKTNGPYPYYTPKGGYWEAPNRASFDWIHQEQSGIGFTTIHASTIIAYLWTEASDYQIVYTSNGTSVTKRGIDLEFYDPGGAPSIQGSITNAVGSTYPVPASFFAEPNANNSNWQQKHWAQVVLRSQYGGKTEGFIDGIKVYEGTMLSSSPSTSTDLLRFFQRAAGGDPFTGRLAFLGFYKEYMSDNVIAGINRWIGQEYGFPPPGGTLIDGESYAGFPGAVKLPDGQILAQAVVSQNHSQYESFTIRGRSSSDNGWTFGPIDYISGRITPGGTVRLEPTMSLIGDTLYSCSGGTTGAPASMWKCPVAAVTSNAYAWALDGLLDGQPTELGTLTATESNTITDLAGRLLCGVHVDQNTTKQAKMMRRVNGAWSILSTIASGAETTFSRKPGTDSILAAISQSSTASIQLAVSPNGGVNWTTSFQIAAGHPYPGKPFLLRLKSGGIVLSYRSNLANNRAVYKYLAPSFANAHNYAAVNWTAARPVSPLAGFYLYAEPVEISDGVVTFYYSEEPGAQANSKASVRYRSFSEAEMAVQ